jgi:hypothetical protein
MNSYKNIACQILAEAKKPLHSREITKIALQRGLLQTSGKTPQATMNAQLVMDVVKNKDKSLFIKTAPSVFALNGSVSKASGKKKPVETSKAITENFVKDCMLKWLSANGWGYFQFGDLHDKGVDIKAKHHQYGRYFFIETKGDKHHEVNFVYSLGQIVSRMKAGGTTRNYYGLGLPSACAKIASRRLPWQVAKKLLLSVFSVGPDGNVEQITWQDLKKTQTKSK